MQAVAPVIKALLILDGDGGRICSKYYTPEWPTLEKQLAFEKVLFAKTRGCRVDGTRGMVGLGRRKGGFVSELVGGLSAWAYPCVGVGR
jgi:hypothetical protein